MGKAIVSSKTILAKKKRKVFLRILAQTGKVAEAARAVGFQDTSSLQKFRRDDEDFAEEWGAALDSAKHVLEEEAIDRAVNGVLEPTYYKGEIVGYTAKKSDALMMFLLRKLDPSYRDTSRGGDTNITFGIAVLPMTAQSDEAWEKRALTMHGNQTIIEVEAKPVENRLSRVQRGD